MTETSKRCLILGLPIVGILFIIIIPVSRFLEGVSLHPSDRLLIDHFQSHRDLLEKLMSMAREDLHVETIFSDQVMFDDYKIWPHDGVGLFSPQRWGQYKIVFNALRPFTEDELKKDGILILIPASVRTTEPDKNLEYRVSVKGYAYSPVSLPVQSSLDSLGVNELGRTYRRIDEHWYLYHDCGIGKPE